MSGIDETPLTADKDTMGLELWTGVLSASNIDDFYVVRKVSEGEGWNGRWGKIV